jgi:hypothetical protein
MCNAHFVTGFGCVAYHFALLSALCTVLVFRVVTTEKEVNFRSPSASLADGHSIPNHKQNRMSFFAGKLLLQLHATAPARHQFGQGCHCHLERV